MRDFDAILRTGCWGGEEARGLTRIQKHHPVSTGKPMIAMLSNLIRTLAAAWARAWIKAPSARATAHDPSPTDSGTHPAVAQRAAWNAVKKAPQAPRAPWLDPPTPPSWRPGMA